MSNLGYSFIPVHPGEIIKEELQSRGISQKRFAEVVGVSYTMLNDILNGRRPVSTDFALLIEAATNINAEMLMNMQTRYNMQIARKDKNVIAHLENLRKICATLLYFSSTSTHAGMPALLQDCRYVFLHHPTV